MAVLAGCGWKSVCGLALLVTSVVVLEYAVEEAHQQRVRVAALSAAWSFSAWVVYTLFAGNEKVFGLHLVFTLWLVAIAISPSASRRFRASALSWRILVVAWLCFAAAIALGMGYCLNDARLFYVGLAGAFGSGLVLLWWFKLPQFCAQAVITLLLVIAGLPLVDSFVRSKPVIQEPIMNYEKYYSYEGARKDPQAYEAWSWYAMTRWIEFEKGGIDRRRVGEVPFQLRPNTRSRLFDSEVMVNSLGFRGREFFPHKTNAYRIIALGESTTFGYTLTADQRPWAELLEDIIRERLKPSRPVEVINAGFPGRILTQNIYRLKHELLNYEPDMLISYHGYNGFHLLSSAIPQASGAPPPPYSPRPAKLLGDAEYNLRLRFYRRSRMGKLISEKADFSKPLETPYADAYRELIQIAETNHIQLVLASYSMAVTSRSDPDLIQFYHGGFPAIYTQIPANEAHTLIVEKLAAEHPTVCFVNTHPGLDGEHQKFVDLMHFNKKGEEQMAETLFAAIRPILERELQLTAGK